MNKYLIFLLVLIQLLLPACNKEDKEKTFTKSNKALIYVTIAPQKSIITAIGGKYTDVKVLIPPNLNPHDYQPKPQQLLNLTKASAYFEIGLPFEIILKPKLKEISSKIHFFNMNSNIKPITHKVNGVIITDPHIWLSPTELKIIAKNTYQSLVVLMPKHKDYFYRNYRGYIKRLNSVYAELKQILAPYKGKTFFVFHPAFGYFSRDFELKQQAVEIDGLAPPPKALLSIIQQAQKQGVKIIFAEPQFSKKTAQALAKEINGNVILINPLSENIINNFVEIADKLKYSFSMEKN